MSEQIDFYPQQLELEFPDWTLNDLIQQAQWEGFSPEVTWSQELAPNIQGHVVEGFRTRRVLAVIEKLDGDTKTWLAQTFRIRANSEETRADYELACLQMMEEIAHHPQDSNFVRDMLRTLQAGHGLSLQYRNVVFECNDPKKAEGSHDTQHMTFGPSGSSLDYNREAPTESLDLAVGIRDQLTGDHSHAADIIVDIGNHMGYLAKQFRIDGKWTTVYRTHLSNYPWAYNEDGPLTNDLVLIKVDEGSIWYIGQIDFDGVIDPENIDDFIEYESQLMEHEVLDTAVSGIASRVTDAMEQVATVVQLPDALGSHAVSETGFVEEVAVINPFELLEQIG